MKDFYLKFDNEVAAKAALIEAGFAADEDGNVYHEECAVDWVGIITRIVGGTEEEPVYEAVEGYHVNVRTWGDIEFPADMTLHPATPVRVWA